MVSLVDGAAASVVISLFMLTTWKKRPTTDSCCQVESLKQNSNSLCVLFYSNSYSYSSRQFFSASIPSIRVQVLTYSSLLSPDSALPLLLILAPCIGRYLVPDADENVLRPLGGGNDGVQ